MGTGHFVQEFGHRVAEALSVYLRLAKSLLVVVISVSPPRRRLPRLVSISSFPDASGTWDNFTLGRMGGSFKPSPVLCTSLWVDTTPCHTRTLHLLSCLAGAIRLTHK